MKFLPLLDEVTSALNFHTPNCRVVGSCDLYTTKAAGSDKKLYRNIENSLESQYESLLRLSASASPPQDSINLSRSSPFGSLSQVSNRRTFAYLLATLNASHVDYDFSHILRPTDFRKGTLKAAMSIIDSTLYNLRPATLGMTLQVPSQTSYAVASSTPVTSQWNPSMWSRIDNEMILKDCTVYCWAPPDEPFDGEEGSIWSLHYFFFNKEKKRVAYIYIRGVPVMSHSPGLRSGMPKRSASGYDSGANKRAKYWLGDQAANITTDQDADLDQDDSVWNDDSDTMFDGDEFCDNYDDEADDESDEQEYKGPVRGMSEDIAASMDME
ncbi:hypothetical protein B7494_g3594 [Chlorociboria aeruginascens]|nr:hypothetical protein B7494_g3594 [Chlorociboria aeruginascens]